MGTNFYVLNFYFQNTLNLFFNLNEVQKNITENIPKKPANITYHIGIMHGRYPLENDYFPD